ncbi:hypothetical protein [Streptomyces sp. NBC_01353]|uniref:hypothetical protein n=1 Tax=Streptomyces sp. NBC_01353 TaxID=2903835 RepID=UPI002E37287E|nr:hypothetical protein [Streptomyces sp. NBC_01353]
MFTEGLMEAPPIPSTTAWPELAELAIAYIGLPLQEFVDTLADHHPSDGQDGMAILALRNPRT